MGTYREKVCHSLFDQSLPNQLARWCLRRSPWKFVLLQQLQCIARHEESVLRDVHNAESTRQPNRENDVVNSNVRWQPRTDSVKHEMTERSMVKPAVRWLRQRRHAGTKEGESNRPNKLCTQYCRDWGVVRSWGFVRREACATDLHGCSELSCSERASKTDSNCCCAVVVAPTAVCGNKEPGACPVQENSNFPIFSLGSALLFVVVVFQHIHPSCTWSVGGACDGLVGGSGGWCDNNDCSCTAPNDTLSFPNTVCIQRTII